MIAYENPCQGSTIALLDKVQSSVELSQSGSGLNPLSQLRLGPSWMMPFHSCRLVLWSGVAWSSGLRKDFQNWVRLDAGHDMVKGIPSPSSLDMASHVGEPLICGVRYHLHRLGLAHTSDCPCGTGPHTPEHILQLCPVYDQNREQIWPMGADLDQKLWGARDDLLRTIEFIQNINLKVWDIHPAFERRRRRRSLCL